MYFFYFNGLTGPKKTNNGHLKQNVILRWTIMSITLNQASIIITLMSITNYIRKDNWFDETFTRAQQKFYNLLLTEGGINNKVHEECTSIRRTNNDEHYMTRVSDMIVGDITEMS